MKLDSVWLETETRACRRVEEKKEKKRVENAKQQKLSQARKVDIKLEPAMKTAISCECKT